MAKIVRLLKAPQSKIKVAIVGKYLDIGDFSLTDSYVSIYQALVHAGAQIDVGIDIAWINAHLFETNSERLSDLAIFDGVIIPGGFGNSGVEGKIAAISYVRAHKFRI